MEAQLQLVKTTASHVRCFIDQAMNFECNGCLADHPSQINHECLMLSGEDRIRFCLDRALLLVDWEKVKTDFHHSCPQTSFHDQEWFQTLWTDNSWFEQLVSALLLQECLSDAWPDLFPIYILLNKSSQRLSSCGGRTKKKKKNDRLCHQVPRCWPHTTACRSPGHGIGRPGLMVTYPENVQRNRWLGILDLFLRTGNGALEGPSGPPVVGGGCDSIQNGGQIRINPPPTTGGGPGGPSTLLTSMLKYGIITYPFLNFNGATIDV